MRFEGFRAMRSTKNQYKSFYSKLQNLNGTKPEPNKRFENTL